jgi:hypothetical protein
MTATAEAFGVFFAKLVTLVGDEVFEGSFLALCIDSVVTPHGCVFLVFSFRP